MSNLKKLFPLIIMVMLLLTSCGSTPYKTWEEFEQMKKDVGDHFLYPTYIPDGLSLTSESWYNSTLFKERAKNPYYGYTSYAFDESKCLFCVRAIDPKLKKSAVGDSTQTYEYETIESWTEDLMGIELSISTIYTGVRVTSVKFEINSISYSTSYQSEEDASKNTDPVQLEELLKVAKSIIEQTHEEE